MNESGPAASAFENLFRPRSIAVLGASPEAEDKVASRTIRDLLDAKWTGTLLPVSPHYSEIHGFRCYSSLRDVPVSPDVVLARIAAKHTFSAIQDAIAVGAKFLMILASGFSETGAEGRQRESELVAAARGAGLRILGPQCIGLFNMIDRIPMSLGSTLYRLKPIPGNVALVAQSGAFMNLLTLQLQLDYGINFSHVVSCGNAADIVPEELLNYLTEDESTDVIGLYLEGVRNGRLLAEAAWRAHQSGKAVVLLCAGLSSIGRLVAASHTASVAPDRDLLAAFCKEVGMCLCSDEAEFVTAISTFASKRVGSASVGFMSGSGGACALFADLCTSRGLELPPLSPKTRDQISALLPWYLSPRLPLDMGVQFFDDDLFRRALIALEADPSVSIVVVHCFTHNEGLLRPREKALAIREVAALSKKPFIVVWHNAMDMEAQLIRESSRIVTLVRSLGEAADCCRLIAARFSERPRPTWLDVAADAPKTAWISQHAAVGAVSNDRRLGEFASKALLTELSFPVPAGGLATSPATAVSIARRIGYPVALKLQSPLITHKSDAGLVLLRVTSDPEVETGFARLIERGSLTLPNVAPDGILVEQMVTDEHFEMLLTIHWSESLGHFVSIGLGGLHVEILKDVVHCKAPATQEEIRAALQDLKIYPVLAGARGHSGYDLNAFADLASRLSRVATKENLKLVELNPIFVLERQKGCVIIDALIERE